MRVLDRKFRQDPLPYILQCTLAGIMMAVILMVLNVVTETALIAALAVSLSIFVMVITDTEHAPAAGLSLGFVLNPWNSITIVLILFSISFMATSKRLLKKWMTDLI